MFYLRAVARIQKKQIPQALADLDSAAAIVVMGLDLKEEIPVLYLRVKRAAEIQGRSVSDDQ